MKLKVLLMAQRLGLLPRATFAAEPPPPSGQFVPLLDSKALKPVNLQPILRLLCETLLRCGDPELAFTAQLDLPLGASNGKK